MSKVMDRIATVARETAASLLGPNGVRLAFEMVTATQAQEWLDQFNVGNRTLKRTKAELYARDMKAGFWRPDTCEAIKFGRDGRLLDGQNRLHALVLAGGSQMFLVARGCPPEIQGVIDTIVPRSAADLLRFKGTENAHLAVAITKKVILWEGGRRIRLDAMPVSHSEVLTRYGVDIVAATEAAGRYRATPCAGSVVGFVWFITHAISPEEAELYFHQLASGEGLLVGNPALAVREWLIRMRTAKHTLTMSDALITALIRGWNALREGRDLQKIYASGKGSGDIPEPQ